MHNIKLDQLDRAFDRYSTSPIISSVTGAGRILFGAIEVIVGLVKTIFNGIGMQFNPSYEAAFNKGVMHLFFGAGNILKGTIEAIPLIGNFLVHTYNFGDPCIHNQVNQSFTREAWSQVQPPALGSPAYNPQGNAPAVQAN